MGRGVSPVQTKQAWDAEPVAFGLGWGRGRGGGGTVPPAEVRKAQLSPAHEKAGPRLQSRTAFAVCPQTRSLQNLSEPPACSRAAGPW